MCKDLVTSDSMVCLGKLAVGALGRNVLPVGCEKGQSGRRKAGVKVS